MTRYVRTLSPLAEKLAAQKQAAMLAALFAQEIGLAPGNRWEPPIARNIEARYHELGDWEQVEGEFRFRLGIAEGWTMTDARKENR
jgi:hypothetical protein